MANAIKSRVIRIGNSQGIRIPKPLMEQAGLSDEVELEAQAGQLIVRPARQVRVGWEESFRQMALNGDDKLLDDEALTLTEWEEKEWQW